MRARKPIRWGGEWGRHRNRPSPFPQRGGTSPVLSHLGGCWSAQGARRGVCLMDFHLARRRPEQDDDDDDDDRRGRASCCGADRAALRWSVGDVVDGGERGDTSGLFLWQRLPHMFASPCVFVFLGLHFPACCYRCR